MNAHNLAKVFVTGVVTVLAALSPQVLAEEPFATELDASSARDFIGKWTISMDMGGRTMSFDLVLVDVEGKLGGTIDSARQPEPRAIDSMAMNEEGGLIMDYEMSFGSQSFKLQFIASLVEDGLEGNVKESSGLFEAAFTATETEDDPEASQQRRRNRRGAANMARLRLDGGVNLRVSFGALKVDSEDHKRLEELGDSEVFEFVGGRATKLFTDVDMVFPEATVKTENAAPNYPGVYSLWLKKAGDGWSLVFNEEADIWGTMHNPEADAAEIALVAGTLDEPAETFKVELKKTDAGGQLRIMWGKTVWTADFKVEKEESKTASTS